jgi:hypothetical protein
MAASVLDALQLGVRVRVTKNPNVPLTYFAAMDANENWDGYDVGTVTKIVERSNGRVVCFMEKFYGCEGGEGLEMEYFGRHKMFFGVDAYMTLWEVVDDLWVPPPAPCSLCHEGHASLFFGCNHLLCRTCFNGIRNAALGSFMDEAFQRLPPVCCHLCRSPPRRLYSPIPERPQVFDVDDFVDLSHD